MADYPLPMAALLQSGHMPPPLALPPGRPNGLSLADFLQAQAQGGNGMVPTLTGIENRTPTPGRAAVMAAGSGVDYGRPATGMPSMADMLQTMPRQEMTAPGGTEFLQELSDPAAGRVTAMPRSMDQARDLEDQARYLHDMATTVAPMVAGGGPAVQGLQMAGRAAAAAAAPVARAAAANPTLAGFLAAGGATLATPGETSDAPPLRERAPSARQAETGVRARLTTAEEDLRKAREDVARYDDKSFNWRDPDAVEAAQRNFQGMDIRVRDPRTGAMVSVPSDRRDGPLTRAGAAEYARRAAARVKELETGMTALRDELRRAGDDVRVSEGLDAREVSARRMRELDEPTLVQRFGPNAGYAAGFAQGIGERWLLGRAFRGLGQARTDRANLLMGEMGRGDVNQRVGKLNQFWQEGGSRNPPFTYQPGRTPYPWASAPDAPPRGASSVFTPRDPAATAQANRLYRPGALENYGPVAGTSATGAYEWWQGEHNIEDAAREYSAAQAAIAGKDAPTEAEMQRVRDARQSAAWAQALRNAGRGAIAGGAMTDLHMRAHAPARPNIGRAEAERADLDLMLNPRSAPPPAGGGGPPTMLPHSSNFQPRSGSRFAPGRPVYPPGDPRRGR